MSNTPIAGLIRSIAIALGTIAVSLGIIDDQQIVDQAIEAIVAFVGATTVVIATIHSILSKVKK